MDSPPAPRTHLFPPKQKGGRFGIKHIYVWWYNCKTCAQMEIFELLACKLCSFWKGRRGNGCDDVDEDDGGDTGDRGDRADRGRRDFAERWVGKHIMIWWSSYNNRHRSIIICVMSTLWQTGNRRAESGNKAAFWSTKKRKIPMILSLHPFSVKDTMNCQGQ